MDQSNGIINVETFVNSQKQSNEIITIEEPEEQKAEEVEDQGFVFRGFDQSTKIET